MQKQPFKSFAKLLKGCFLVKAKKAMGDLSYYKWGFEDAAGLTTLLLGITLEGLENFGLPFTQLS